MVNGAFNLSSDPRDFRLKRGDARVELVDRERIEILARQGAEHVVGASRLIVVRVDGRAHGEDR